MKRNLVYLLGGLLILVASCSFTNKSFEGSDKDKLLIDLITYVLEKGHLSPKDLDDDFSREVYDSYINALDPLKRYFLASDIKEFDKYKEAIDDQIKASDVAFFNLTYDRLVQRMTEARAVYKEVLKTPFDFEAEERIDLDYENLPYAKNKKELTERWRKQLKFSALERYAGVLENDKVEKEDGELKDIAPNGKLTDKVSTEKEARENTLTAMNDYFSVMDDLERTDWFVLYLNSIVEEFDPHTSYMAPEAKERFDTDMSGKFEGIGARLQKKNDYIKIVEIISGGPAWRENELEVGDEIIKVAQEGEDAVDIVGMRLSDAVKLIKGPKGTKVFLTLKRVDGTIEEISITRDVVELEESYVKSSTVEKDGKTFGVINLPKFYVDFTDYKERNAASDVAQEITRLKKQGMEGLVLDLRNNGGGSLKTVVDMAGLFIEEGPVVQIKSTGKRKEVLEDKDERIQWNGPLVILVNELSASASEILAAAMQDYKRAIVIGSKQTYGKGTVQNVIDLNQFLRGDNDFGNVGAMKLTTQKFYRINGGSTQLEGVKSDVVVPDRYSYIDIGEKDQENPLPWDKIDPASYKTWDGYIDYEEAINNSKKRMADNRQLKLIDSNARWVKSQQDIKEYSLNYDAYVEAMNKDQETVKQFRAISDYKTNLTFNSLPYEQDLMVKDSTLRQKRDRWHADLAKDVYMEEALNVLEDLHLSNIKRGKVAGIKG
ncbi:carboxy terminal-processing peptidase [Zhouia spongiae]|uniref:Carboxy terminal-processing peptidase n=1 Tax=Zhouia spongiae TaxID=2202721 RepID=A0ABY3YRL7_9FLAO|nr:carboxy terminal-processing peptidase [Zhouia spongiae]UNZ00468.1 carboxy terminal-processing peptidase [Zhouia spongiae]